MSLKKQFNKERAEILNTIPNRNELEKIILRKLKVNMNKNKGNYFTFDDLFSIKEVEKYFNLFYATGDRNIGKTYDMRKRIIKRFEETGYGAVWLRRLNEDIKKILTSEEWDEGYTLKKGDRRVLKGDEVVCNFLFLNTETKSVEFPKASMIFFDEPNTDGRKITNAYDKLSHLISTIQREKKDFQVILTSNYVEQDNDILKKLGLGQKKADVMPLLVFNWVVGGLIWNIPKDWYKKMSLEDKLNNLGYRSSLANYNTYKPQYGGTFKNKIDNHLINIDEFELISNECVIKYDFVEYIVSIVNVYGEGHKLLIDSDDLDEDDVGKVPLYVLNSKDHLLNPDYDILPERYIKLLRTALENYNLVFIDKTILEEWVDILNNLENDKEEEPIWETPILE